MARGRLTTATSLAVLALLLLPGTACDNGHHHDDGGGTVSYGDISLRGVQFPDPNDQSTGGDDLVPDRASLIQLVVLEFSGAVNPAEVSPGGIAVRDASTQELVPGDFEVVGDRVTFHPALPTRPIVALPEGGFDTGGAGLAPGVIYTVTVPVGSPDSIPSLIGVDASVFEHFDYEVDTRDGVIGRNFPPGARDGTFSIRFHTTRNESGFLTGYEPAVPLVTDFAPARGADNQSPKLFTDPDHLFPPFEPYRLEFDQPLDPATDNVSDGTIKIIDLGNPRMELGAFVTLATNRFDGCEVLISPSGILPFGHELGIEVPRDIRQISGGSSGDNGREIITTFRVANAPEGTVRDEFVEEFSDNAREEQQPQDIGTAAVRAEWDRDERDDLRSTLGFPGGGELGPFLPFAPPIGQPPHVIVLDTNSQTLPLFDGSTPGAKAGTVVEGGVFNFTSIVIPANVIVRGAGKNPLVLTAIGSVAIAGEIDVSGGTGGIDQTYDSAITPTPGGLAGPGGGRGGDGHPTVVDVNGDFDQDGQPDGDTVMNYLPPARGARGIGAFVRDGAIGFTDLGGEGGQSAIESTTLLDCNPGQTPANDNGSRGAGGGGGTFLGAGARGRDGLGDFTSSERFSSSHLPIYEPIPEGDGQGGEPGAPVFADADPLNDFIGKLGEIPLPLGGQGGGGGGSRLDSYYCGSRYSGYPATVTDSKGGGGGGGAGALVVRALGEITFSAATGKLAAAGGWGGTGEQVGCGNWGGGGGGGSGGLVILESATMVTLDGTGDSSDDDCSSSSCVESCDVDVDVRGGEGGYVVTSTSTLNTCSTCNLGPGRSRDSRGSGGAGGSGLVQLMVPAGKTPQISPEVFLAPDPSAVKTPASELTPLSVAQSTWLDVGQVIQRGPTSPSWSFRGTDPGTGQVITDAEGNIVSPELNPFRIDMPPVIDPVTGEILKRGRADFIHPDASVKIEFQAGDAVQPGAKDVDESSLTPWSADIAVGEGHQFLRYRVIFNLADLNKNPSAELSPKSRTSSMRFIRLALEF